jgi:hypothetical protein
VRPYATTAAWDQPTRRGPASSRTVGAATRAVARSTLVPLAETITGFSSNSATSGRSSAHRAAAGAAAPARRRPPARCPGTRPAAGRRGTARTSSAASRSVSGRTLTARSPSRSVATPLTPNEISAPKEGSSAVRTTVATPRWGLRLHGESGRGPVETRGHRLVRRPQLYLSDDVQADRAELWPVPQRLRGRRQDDGVAESRRRCRRLVGILRASSLKAALDCDWDDVPPVTKPWPACWRRWARSRAWSPRRP